MELLELLGIDALYANLNENKYIIEDTKGFI